MRPPPLGIDLQDLRTDTRSALRQAARMEFNTVELPGAEGETTPQNLSPSGRRHLQRIVADLGLSMSALSADFPGLRISDSRSMEERVEKTCAIIDLAADLSVPIVTATIGALTHPDTGQPSDAALEALQRIAEFADSRNRVFAIRPTHDSAERLEAVLKAVGSPLIRIGLDPAALLFAGINPMPVVARLAPFVSLIHLRDGAAGRPDRPGMETRIGEGEVDLRGLTDSLRDFEYQGPLILRRTDSQNPSADLVGGRDYVRRML